MVITPRYWKRNVKEAFKNDPIRIVIELIKNSADSYFRLKERGEISPPFKIWANVRKHRGNPPFIEVRDQAEGMSYEKLKGALAYGTDVTDYTGTAEKGIGLKDSLMAMAPNGSILTIKDGKLSGYKIQKVGYLTPLAKDETVTEEKREDIEIPSNGTIVKGTMPEYFSPKTYSTLVDHLSKHFLLRKLLQHSEFEIYLKNAWTGKITKLAYKEPKIDKTLLDERFKIKYDGRDYKADIKIHRSKEKIKKRKPIGKGGLIFYYSDYSVIEHTLGDYSRNPVTDQIFGEVKLYIKDLIESGEILVDEKRRGLDTTHSFNNKLMKQVNKKLEKVIEMEKEESKYTVDDSKKKDILKKLNEIGEEAIGKGPKKPARIPKEPNTFTFSKPYMTIKELEEKNNYLIVNSDIVPPSGLEIKLGSDNPDIKIKRKNKLILEQEDFEENEFLIRSVPVFCKKPGVNGEIFAETEDEKEVVGIESIENPIFNPEDGFEFIPNKTTIVDNGEKDVDLIIDSEVITNNSREIKFGSSSMELGCPGKRKLPKKSNLDKYRIRDILKVPIPIKVKGEGNVGKNGKISAKYEDKSSEISVKVVQNPLFGGLFRDIEFSPKDSREVVDFEEGILNVYHEHPLMKKYMNKDGFRKKKDFLVFTADSLTREACRAIIETAIDRGSSQYAILDQDNPEPEIREHYLNQYYENGSKFHDLFFDLLKNFEIKT